MILVDTNVLLDVIERREPQFAHSAALIERVIRGDLEAGIAAHGVTTLHYLVARTAGNDRAEQVLDWLLEHFSVVQIGPAEIARARAMRMRDFEDAVVAAAALAAGCSHIVTGNVRDFAESPVPAVLPEEFSIDAIHERIVAEYRVTA